MKIICTTTKLISLIALFFFFSNSIFAYPWGHRYVTEQANQNITVDINTSFTVSVEWGEGDWDATEGSMFGYGLTVDGSGWIWVDLPWFQDGEGSNKRCKTSISISIPGKYYYAYRMKKASNGGTSYSFGTDSWSENSGTLNAYATLIVGKVSAMDGDWSSSSTWEGGSVPSSASNVAILHNVYISTNETAATLIIYSGISLSINPTKSLTVSGTFTNNAGISGLVIESDATGTGSLIEYNGVSATVERYLTDDRWHYVSAPVDNPTAGVFMGMYLKYWDEPTSVWTYITNPDYILATDMMGYALWTYNTATATFTGNLNTGSKSLNVTNTDGGPWQNDGFNFAGNPYPSAINWNVDDGSGWARTNIDAAIYIWNHAFGNYGVYTKDAGTGTNDVDSIIPPHQGFFIHCDSAAGTATLNVNNGARVHNTKEIYKSEPTLQNILKLIISGNNYSDEIILNKLADATVNFDVQFDALKLRGYESAPQLYSVSKDSKDLSINSFPETEEYNVIPIGLEVGALNSYTLSISKLAEFGSSGNLYMEDKKEGIFLKIENDSFTYSFTADPSDDPMRFLLHLNGEMGIETFDTENPDLRIYAFENDVYINSNSNIHGTITVYDLLGKIVVQSGMDGETIKKIDMGNHKGFMLVTMFDEGRYVNKKVFIR